MFSIMLMFVMGLPDLKVTLSRYDVYSSTEPIAVNGDGTVLVSSTSGFKLMAFDKKGTFLGSIGKQGEGPGEFQAFTSIVWDAKLASFWVLDFRNRRLTRISPALIILETVALKTDCNLPIQVNGDHFYIERDNNGKLGSEPYIAQYLIRDTRHETVLFKQPALDKQHGLHGKFGAWLIFMSYKWDPRLLFGIGSDFTAVAYSEEPLFQIYSGGKKTLTVRLPFPRVPLTDDVFEQGLEDAHPKELWATAKTHLKKPSFWAALQALKIDDQNFIWVFGPAKDEVNHPVARFDNKGTLLHSGLSPYIPSHIVQGKGYALIEKDDEILLTAFNLMEKDH